MLRARRLREKDFWICPDHSSPDKYLSAEFFPLTCGDIGGGWFYVGFTVTAATKLGCTDAEKAAAFINLRRRGPAACATGPLKMFSAWLPPLVPAISVMQRHRLPKTSKAVGLLFILSSPNPLMYRVILSSRCSGGAYSESPHHAPYGLKDNPRRRNPALRELFYSSCSKLASRLTGR